MTDAGSAQVVPDRRPCCCLGPVADLVAMYRRPNADDVVEVVAIEEQDNRCLVVLQVLKH